jgi:hypothetical protein
MALRVGLPQAAAEIAQWTHYVKAIGLHSPPESNRLPSRSPLRPSSTSLSDRSFHAIFSESFMKKLLTLALAAAFALSAAPAFAGPQQDKMKSCNKEATEKSLKGDERKKFMSECLKAAPAAAAEAPKDLAPKDVMKACMAAAKGKKGDEFKTFKAECMKAGGPAKMK